MKRWWLTGRSVRPVSTSSNAKVARCGRPLPIIGILRFWDATRSFSLSSSLSRWSTREKGRESVSVIASCWDECKLVFESKFCLCVNVESFSRLLQVFPSWIFLVTNEYISRPSASHARRYHSGTQGERRWRTLVYTRPHPPDRIVNFQRIHLIIYSTSPSNISRIFSWEIYKWPFERESAQRGREKLGFSGSFFLLTPNFANFHNLYLDSKSLLFYFWTNVLRKSFV